LVHLARQSYQHLSGRSRRLALYPQATVMGAVLVSQWGRPGKVDYSPRSDYGNEKEIRKKIRE
jgi:hypothetical protein